VSDDLEPGEVAVADDARPASKAVRHAKRFNVFMGVLIFLAVGSMALAAFMALTSAEKSRSAGSAWAPFQPTSDGVDSGARQIAEHVGPEYRLPTGEQIVLVTGGPMELQDLPMRIAVRQSVADGGQIKLLDGKGVLYRMCGLGPKCAIAKGAPTKERGLLLRREALELALYSFHYLDDVEHVVVLIPPPKGEDPSVALHFTRDDVAGQLARPLKATLPLPVPNPDTVTTAPDTPFIERFTIGNLFKFSLTTGNQDAFVYLVLDPPQTQS
jgi:hypothetical protein